MYVQSTEATYFCMCILLRYASPKRGLSVAGPMAQLGAGWAIISHVTGLAKDSQPLQVAFILPKEYQLLVAPNLVARTSNSYVAPEYSRYRSAIPHCKHIIFVGIIVPHYHNSHRPSVEPSTFRTLLRLPSDIAYLSSSHDVSPIHIDFPHPARLG